MYGSVLRGIERSSERKVVTVLLCRPLNLKWFGVRVTPDFRVTLLVVLDYPESEPGLAQ